MNRTVLSVIFLLSMQPGSFADNPAELERLRESYKNAVMRAVTPLTATYIRELEKLRDSYTRAGNLDAATAVVAELRSIKQEVERPVNPDGRMTLVDADAKIPANDPNGYRVGAVKKGDTITLTYVSGKWKNDGNVPSEDPDANGSSRGDLIRLVISQATKTTKAGPVINVVRAGTANKPYTYVFPMDHDDVVLRINSGTKESPGAVVYHVSVTR